MKENQALRKQTAKVVLSGGAAMGLAEIGVLQVLDNRYDITGIIGTSMGAIVGGLYANGYSPEDILQLVIPVKTNRLFSPFSLDSTLSGIFDGKKLLALFDGWTAGSQIEDCRIPFMAMAYDLNKGNSIILNQGPLAKVMRASSSIPYLFSPYHWGKYCFVDGGVEHPLPLGLAKSLPGELTIAVNVLPVKFTKPDIVDVHSEAVKHCKYKGHDVFLQSIIHNQAHMAMQSILDNKPDIVIDAWYPGSSVFGFDKAETYYAWGRSQTRSALENSENTNYLDKILQKYRSIVARVNAGFPKNART